MQRAETTKTNDVVTLRQFHRFLENAKLPPRWKCSVEKLNDVLQIAYLSKEVFELQKIYIDLLGLVFFG